MFSGGAVLELYAVRKASSVLEALAKRMPSVAHRKSGEKWADITTEKVNIGDSLKVANRKPVLQNCQRGFVIGLVCYFVDELGINHIVMLIDNDDCPGGQAGQ